MSFTIIFHITCPLFTVITIICNTPYFGHHILTYINNKQCCKKIHFCGMSLIPSMYLIIKTFILTTSFHDKKLEYFPTIFLSLLLVVGIVTIIKGKLQRFLAYLHSLIMLIVDIHYRYIGDFSHITFGRVKRYCNYRSSGMYASTSV